MPNKLFNRTNRTIECPLPGKRWLRLLPGEHRDLSDADARASRVLQLLRRKGVELRDVAQPPPQKRAGRPEFLEATSSEPEDVDVEIVGAEDLAPPPNAKKRGEGTDANG